MCPIELPQHICTLRIFSQWALKWVHDVGVIVHRSPKKKHALDQLRATYDEQGGPGPSSICPTRWTVRVRSIEGLLSSYLSVLTFLCDLSEQNTTEIIEDGKRVNISTKARGLHDQLGKGGVYFTILALRDVFSPCEELSKTLQSPSYTVSGAKQAVNLTLQKLKRMRSSDDHFETLWAEMEAAKEKYNLTEPTLPRCRNPPAQNEYNPSHTSVAHQFNAAKDKIRKEYFELLDLAISEINSRFDQDDFNKLRMMETALLTHPNDWGSDSKNIEDLLESYGFNVRKLKCNPESLSDIAPGCTIGEVAEKFAELQPQARRLFSQLEDLLILLLVVPVSAATAERTFSMIRRLKTYLRSTMGQARLNHLALLTVYKERDDLLNVYRLMQIFVKNYLRHSIFGKI
ncbi:Zinc finger MYM-type protein 1 [Frankliniella fusca]|uniref:Zinc finger MYM-type protein 1 n=1 Tax=Frankliniella fusca TaxID=407009 RepID=A0AAE1L7G4_9NEOP|nr:Zinc finger MYM-type protein 1 [Frankliniella fusca]